MVARDVQALEDVLGDAVRVHGTVVPGLDHKVGGVGL